MPLNCCNPFGKANHKTNKVRASLRPIAPTLVEVAKQHGIILNSEDTICTSCRIQIKKAPIPQLDIPEEIETHDVENITENIEEMPLEEGESTTDISEGENSSTELYKNDNVIIEDVNRAIEQLGESPIAAKRMRYKTYATKKFQNVTEALAKDVFNVATTSNTENTVNTELNELINELKEKFKSVTNVREKYMILTTLPKSWTIRKIRDEFNISYHMARKAKKLRAENGVMSTPNLKLAHNTLKPEVIEEVKNFYRSDDISRACPGKRDYVFVNENGEKISKQRRLLLSNLKETYHAFKQLHPTAKIGFSAFTIHRPKEVLLALDKYGIQCVCVCAYHQNVKLMFEPMKRKQIFTSDINSYNDLCSKLLCANPNPDCHLNKCKDCAGTNVLEVYLEELFDAKEIDEFTFKQWTTCTGNLLFKTV